jgi:hypothetical protein
MANWPIPGPVMGSRASPLGATPLDALPLPRPTRSPRRQERANLEEARGQAVLQYSG